MKMIIQDQHGHIAASAVTNLGNAADLIDHGLAQCWIEIVKLSSVCPWGEIRISSVGNYFRACRGILRDEKIAGIGAIVSQRAPNVVLGVFRDPVMVRPGVVGDDIQNQPHAELVQMLMERSKVFPAANHWVWLISLNGKRRSGHIVQRPPGKTFVVSLK